MKKLLSIAKSVATTIIVAVFIGVLLATMLVNASASTTNYVCSGCDKDFSSQEKWEKHIAKCNIVIPETTTAESTTLPAEIPSEPASDNEPFGDDYDETTEITDENTTVSVEVETTTAVPVVPTTGTTIPAATKPASKPSFDFKIPNIEIPDIEIPDFTIPDIKIPEINIPDIKVPDVEISVTETESSSVSVTVPEVLDTEIQSENYEPFGDDFDEIPDTGSSRAGAMIAFAVIGASAFAVIRLKKD